jgi:amino acid transporter
MIGAGIFSILGVVASVSGAALPVSFVIGGVVALLAAYSYLKLGIRYPSVGGASQFLVEEYGDGLLSGALNIFPYFAYVIAIALYARGFAGYAVTFFPNITSNWIDEVFAVGIIVLFTLVNFLGSRVMGRAETTIVAIKVGSCCFSSPPASSLSPRIDWLPQVGGHPRTSSSVPAYYSSATKDSA